MKRRRRWGFLAFRVQPGGVAPGLASSSVPAGDRGGHGSPSASAAPPRRRLDSGAAPPRRKSILHLIFLTLVFYVCVSLLFSFPFDCISLVSFSVTESPSPFPATH